MSPTIPKTRLFDEILSRNTDIRRSDNATGGSSPFPESDDSLPWWVDESGAAAGSRRGGYEWRVAARRWSWREAGGRTAAGWSARGRGEEPGYCSVPTLSEWGRRHCRTTLHLHPQKPSSSADGSSLAPPFFRYCCMPFLSATAGRAAPGACPAVLTKLLPFNSLYYSIVYFYI